MQQCILIFCGFDLPRVLPYCLGQPSDSNAFSYFVVLTYLESFLIVLASLQAAMHSHILMYPLCPIFKLVGKHSWMDFFFHVSAEDIESSAKFDLHS